MNIKVSIGPNLEVTIFERVDPYPVGYVDGKPRARHLMEDTVGTTEDTGDIGNKSHKSDSLTSRSLNKALRPLRKTAKAVSKLAAALSSKGVMTEEKLPVGRNRAQATSDPVLPLALTTKAGPGNTLTLEDASRRIQELEELNERLQNQLEAREGAYKQRTSDLGGILSSLSRRISMACDNVMASDINDGDGTPKSDGTSMVPYFNDSKSKEKH